MPTRQKLPFPLQFSFLSLPLVQHHQGFSGFSFFVFFWCCYRKRNDQSYKQKKVTFNEGNPLGGVDANTKKEVGEKKIPLKPFWLVTW